MATVYHYVRGDSAGGTVRFRDLVRLVHGGDLGADDLVRADYEDVWRPAAEVVGLFHMARREDVLALWEIENDPASGAARQDATVDSDEIRREVRDGEPQSANVTESHHRGDAEQPVTAVPAGDAAESSVPAAIAAAVTACDARESLTASQTGPTTDSRQALHRVLRWGISLVLANLMAVGVIGWSTTEAQRRPDPEQMSAGIRPFPLWGPCGQTQYAALLVGTMGLAGAAGYAGTRALEALAED